jgi:alpha 1,2-mannosyltransferase
MECSERLVGFMTILYAALLQKQEFVAENPHHVSPNNSLEFISDNGGGNYNLCHCKFITSPRLLLIPEPASDWSNFEIADLDFWRSSAYQEFFDHLESKGGFYYEVNV